MSLTLVKRKGLTTRNTHVKHESSYQSNVMANAGAFLKKCDTTMITHVKYLRYITFYSKVMANVEVFRNKCDLDI